MDYTETHLNIFSEGLNKNMENIMRTCFWIENRKENLWNLKNCSSNIFDVQEILWVARREKLMKK
jgi:hypothetical protein